jgi:hypothetical protein
MRAAPRPAFDAFVVLRAEPGRNLTKTNRLSVGPRPVRNTRKGRTSVTRMTQRASASPALSAAILAAGVLALAGCTGSATSAARTAQPTAGTTTAGASATSAASASSAPASEAATEWMTCPTAATVSSIAGVTYITLQVSAPSSEFPQTTCRYIGKKKVTRKGRRKRAETLTVSLYPAGTTLASLTSVATGTLTPVAGLGSQADSTRTPASAVYVYRSSGAFSVVDGSDVLSVRRVEAVAKAVLGG